MTTIAIDSAIIITSIDWQPKQVKAEPIVSAR
jgi:hypothetical protein